MTENRTTAVRASAVGAAALAFLLVAACAAPTPGPSADDAAPAAGDAAASTAVPRAAGHATGPRGAQPAGDALDALLAEEGLRRADLGWRARGWWQRWPEAPHKLRHFDDLMAEPLATVEFARSFHRAAARWLTPEALAEAPTGEGAYSDGALHQLTWALGVDRRYGGFRSYAANLTAEPTDLVDALVEAHHAAGRRTRFRTLNQDSPYPQIRADLEEAAEAVPAAVRPIVGRLVLDLLSCEEWVGRAFRRADRETLERVAARLDLGVETVDALEYEPAVDDLAATWDEASLWYAGLRAVAAVDRCRHALAALPEADRTGDFAFAVRTPQGWVRITGTGEDHTEVRQDQWITLDLGGADTYVGRFAAATPDRPVSVLLDLAGDDVYSGWEEEVGPTFGSGICGIGVAVDAAGDDFWAGSTHSLGAGQFGMGVLADVSGADTYTAGHDSQGCGYFGIGLLLDGSGADAYDLYSEGQGFGGVAGVGVLADGGGDDRYTAERDPEITGRPSYHSEGRVSVSNAQGVGAGRRGDVSDGHSWAGGIGALVDVAGNDAYTAGNWCQGTGYWFGTGVLHDGDGDDAYTGSVWSQATGAHFCIGVLVDEGGSDVHTIEEGGYDSLAFGHDFTVAVLVNIGGDDVYAAPQASMGHSINRSVAMLLDVGGDDAYRGPADTPPGRARFGDLMTDRTRSDNYFADTTSVGLFLDVGGDDEYATGDAGNDATWSDPADSPNRTARNFSLGRDVPAGEVRLRAALERAPSGR